MISSAASTKYDLPFPIQSGILAPTDLELKISHSWALAILMPLATPIITYWSAIAVPTFLTALAETTLFSEAVVTTSMTVATASTPSTISASVSG